MKRLHIVLISVFLVFCLFALPTLSECFAAPYTYTVVVLAGGQGLFVDKDGKKTDTWSRSGLKYGDRINLSNVIDSVQLTSDRYYVKGIRPSGHDNIEVSTPVFTVTEDSIYVVAYGIKGDMVNYTVRFQDASGKELRAPVTGVGQIGDKPVVAYRYIDGYSPNAYALTKTLTADESANVFTFTYTKVVIPTNTVIVYNDAPANNGNTGNGTGNGNAGNGNNGTAAGTEAETGGQATGINDLDNPVVQAEVIEANSDTGNETGIGSGEGNGEGSEAGSSAGQTPLELIDLDDEDVALAESPDLDNTLNSEAKKLSVIVPIIIIILIILTIFIVRRIKKKKEQEKNEIELF